MRPKLDSLENEIYDVIVIGAGAVGCASARELAGRGYRTLLVDRSDIATGTSSRSSRLLYSGVGYLAPDFPLWQIPFRMREVWRKFAYARNIMHCRAELVADMPHRLTKHRFQYPFRKGDQYPHWLVDFGFRLMETVASRGVPLAYRKISPKQATNESAMVAGLAPQISSVAVFDEYMYEWPERICVDTALDAERRGATIRTYTQVTGIEQCDSLWDVTLDDQAPGLTDQARIKAKTIVNAAGPWVDRVPGGGKGRTKRVVGKKGVNVMVKLPDSWRGQGLEAFSSKGEPFYVFPWGDHHFVGPTESVVGENPDNVHVLDSEIEYILNEANLLFPSLNLSRKDVLHSWCGVRPMSTLDGNTVSLPVRAIEDPQMPGMVTMTGSYIMMHRHAGRLAARSIEKWLGKRGTSPKGMLVGSNDSRNPEDIAQIVKSEHVVRLSDLIRRRLPDGLNPSTLGRDRAKQLCEISAAVLGWSEQRKEQEIQTFLTETDSIYRKP